MTFLQRFFLLLANRSSLRPLSVHLFRLSGVSIGKHVRIGHAVRIGFGASIGDDTIIEDGATISKATRIGKRVWIRSYVRIGESVEIADDVTIGDSCNLARLTVGQNSFLDIGVVCMGRGTKRIILGNDCYIGTYSILNWCGGIEIADKVHLAAAVGIWTHSSVFDCVQGHPLSDVSNRVVLPVRIESRVWIGGNTTIYPGTTIGSQSIVLPNSVVSRPITSGSVVGGAPARPVESTGEILERHGIA